MSREASRTGYVLKDAEALPDEQRGALRRAIRWQVFTIGYAVCTITLVAFVLGNSQAMKTAWIEDMLSMLPQIAFLLAVVFVRRPATLEHPYGWHRAMDIGHLVGGVALFAVGAILAVESAIGLIRAEHPTIGTVVLFGHTVWMGWLMMAVMAVIVVGPLVYGPPKAKLAATLHNKLLFADADMAKADWQTNAASIVGVLGVGLGLWWLDGAAAIFISIGIIRDGLSNTRSAVYDLMDRRARTHDGETPHPLVAEMLDALRARDWIADAALRLREQGQVLHLEAFVQPRGDRVTLEQLGEAAEALGALDWKVHDVVIVPAARLPRHADRGEDGDSGPLG